MEYFYHRKRTTNKEKAKKTPMTLSEIEQLEQDVNYRLGYLDGLTKAIELMKGESIINGETKEEK